MSFYSILTPASEWEIGRATFRQLARAKSDKNKNHEKVAGKSPTRAKNRKICPRKIRLKKP